MRHVSAIYWISCCTRPSRPNSALWHVREKRRE